MIHGLRQLMGRKKLKKRYIICICFVVLIAALFSTFYYTDQKTKQKTESEKVTYQTIESLTASDIYVFGENRQYVAARTLRGVGKRYAVGDEGKFIQTVGGKVVPSHPRRKGEFWNLLVFDLDQENLPSKKIDLYRTVDSYDSDYFPTEMLFVFHYQSTDYLVLEIQKKDDSDQERFVLLNLETQQIREVPQEIRRESFNLGWSYSSKPLMYGAINETTLAKTAYESGFLLDDRISTNSQKKYSRINFTKEYPQVKEILDENPSSVYPRAGMVTPEEWFNQNLHWFAPEGEDLLTVYPVENKLDKNSTPLTDYPIRSYQDYLQWVESQGKSECK